MSVETDWLVPSLIRALVDTGALIPDKDGYRIDQEQCAKIYAVLRPHFSEEELGNVDRVIKETIEWWSDAGPEAKQEGA